MFGLTSSILLGISLAAPVGPVSVEVIKRGLQRGFFSAFAVSLGAAVGDIFYLILTYLGLAPFLANPLVRSVVMFLGSLVLLFLGFQSIYEGLKKNRFFLKGLASEKNAFKFGFVLAVINPMTIVWWLGVFGAVLGSLPPESLTLRSLFSNMAIILGVMIWFSFLSTILHFGKRFITDNRIRYISIISGMCLTGFGIHFGYKSFIDFFSL